MVSLLLMLFFLAISMVLEEDEFLLESLTDGYDLVIEILS
jgi:hypothetical protein